MTDADLERRNYAEDAMCRHINDAVNRAMCWQRERKIRIESATTLVRCGHEDFTRAAGAGVDALELWRVYEIADLLRFWETAVAQYDREIQEINEACELRPLEMLAPLRFDN